MQGNQDPECRASFPWERPAEWEVELKSLIRQLTGLRRIEPALRGTGFRLLAADSGACAFSRTDPDTDAAPSMLVAINAGEADATLPLPHDIPTFSDPVPVIEVGRGPVPPSSADGESARLHVPARSGYVLRMGSSRSPA
jgi:hypothetical protein